MHQRITCVLLLAIGVSIDAGAHAGAKDAEPFWSSRPVRTALGFPPGSSVDTSARIMMPKLAAL